MNAEIPSVPITTLAGVTSLTDCEKHNTSTCLFFIHLLQSLVLCSYAFVCLVLPELPLPKPTSSAQSSKILINDAHLQRDAKQVLHDVDEALVPQLVAALKSTNTSNM